MNIPVLLHSEGKWIKVDSVNIIIDSIYEHTLAYVAIDCADSANCVAFGNFDLTDPYNRVTTDGGKTWFTSLHDSTIFKKDEFGNIIGLINPPKVRDMVYPTTNFCLAICDSGYYWVSRDNLKNWVKRKLDTKYNVFSINFLNEYIGVITGVRTLFLTKDAGINWIKSYIPYKESHEQWFIDDINIINENTIYCLIYDFIDTVSYLYKSYDFGTTWEYSLLTVLRANKLLFIDKYRGWIAGGKQLAPGSSKYTNLILYTSDGGETWEKQLDTLYGGKRFIHKLYFTDENNGYALTQVYNLWKTTNGGKTWLNDPLLYPGYKTDDYFTDIAPINQNKIFGVTEMDRSIYLYQDDTSPVEETYLIKSNSDISIFPNPLSNSGAIKYNLKEPEAIEIKLYDVLGNQLQTLFSGYRDAGFVSIDFSVETIPIGVYYIVFKHNNNVLVEKFVKI